MAEGVPDGLELVKNGTARLVIDGELWKLRRPKLGEYRRLRELIEERDDARISLLAEIETPEKLPDDATPAQKAERTIAIRRAARAIDAKVEELNRQWVASALRVLADHAPPDPDDWPAGMDSVETIVALNNHWRSAPLRSGGS